MSAGTLPLRQWTGLQLQDIQLSSNQLEVRCFCRRMADTWCTLAVGRQTSTTINLVLQGSLANQAAQLGSLAALDISFNHFEGAQLCMQAILQ